jgi:hypothetical protein
VPSQSAVRPHVVDPLRIAWRILRGLVDSHPRRRLLGLGFTIPDFLGFGNTLRHNYVAFNGDKGIISGSTSTIIFNNQSAFNDVGIYLSDGSKGNLVSLNQTCRNDVGIWINATSNHDAVSVNGSYLNFTWDMQDE